MKEPIPEFFSSGYLTVPIMFTQLPTVASDMEYAYVDGEIKVHIYLRPEIPLRKAWEDLAYSFGHENLKWTKEIPHTFRDGTQITGSIYLGLRADFTGLHNIIVRLIEIDQNWLRFITGKLT